MELQIVISFINLYCFEYLHWLIFEIRVTVIHSNFLNLNCLAVE